MISGLTIEVGGRSQTLRMTSRAMMALEDQFDRPIVGIVQGLQTDPRIGTVVRVIAQCGDDGDGMEVSRAQEIVDQIGFEAACDTLSGLIEKAFPEANADQKEAPAKNRKGAGQHRK